MGDSDCGQGYYAGADGECLYWHGSEVTFHLSTSAQNVDPDIVNDFVEATQEWNAYMSGFQIKISNTYVDRGIDVDGMNVIHFELNDWDAEDSNVQGRTHAVASDELEEADIHINLVNFNLSKGAAPFKVDGKSLFIHEIGHALGMVHSEEHFGRVMSPTLAYNYNRRCLFDGDMDVLGNIYSLKGSSPTPRDPISYFGWGKPASSCSSN